MPSELEKLQAENERLWEIIKELMPMLSDDWKKLILAELKGENDGKAV